MTLKGNEMTIQRGETFTIDRLIVNRDGSPFIVSSKYKNPHLLITVASTKYNQQNRYLANWWLNLSDMVRFPNTVVKDVTSLSHISQYMDDSPMEYVYHDLSTDEYKYMRQYNVGETAMFEPYECRIIHHFTHDVTKNWVEQNYLYSIRLIDGEKLDVNSPKPIDKIDVVQDILIPTKLTVLSDLNGGLK